MSKKDVHSVPNPAGKGWVNKVGGEVASRHRTQENAAERGREIARENHSEHAIHRRDGTIGTKNTCSPTRRIRTSCCSTPRWSVELIDDSSSSAVSARVETTFCASLSRMTVMPTQPTELRDAFSHDTNA